MTNNKLPQMALPQVSAPFIEVLKGLEDQGVEFENISVPVSQLKPLQGVVDYDKVNDIIYNVENGGYDLKTIWVSKNNEIVDGHHHYVAAMKMNPENMISCIRINTNHKEVVKLLNSIMDSYDDSMLVDEFDDEIESTDNTTITSGDTETKKDILTGGLADDAEVGDFDPVQLKRGIDIEMEHTKDENLAREIAMDHLTEIPDYYTRLERMEKEAKGEIIKYIAYRDKPVKKKALSGNFFHFQPKEGFSKYEIEFDKILNPEDIGIGVNKINPVVDFCKVWCGVKDLENLASQDGVPVDKYAARLIADKAKSLGYDGINYGNIIIQAF